MSPVFRHGRLRLYLLKLLDEAPRHGYEVIRLLQDRFMGVYAPSPGTIYPRLARLEEEGLVTHDEQDGRKVYRITDKGREEIRNRIDDLAELEEEITESVRDIAREVTQDVRDTVRSLREELTWGARDVRREGRQQARDAARERARRIREDVRESARQARDEVLKDRRQGADDTASEPGRQGADDTASEPKSGDRPGGRRGWDRRQWAEWAASQDWKDWKDLPDWRGRADWAAWRERAGEPGEPGWPFRFRRGGPWGGSDRPGAPGRGGPDAGVFRDLERMAVDFARELRAAAWQGPVGEDALRDLRAILEDTLNRIRDEIFGGGQPTPGEPESTGKAQEDHPERGQDPGA